MGLRAGEKVRFAGSKIRLSCWSSYRFHSIAEAAKFPNHSISAPASGLCVHCGASFFVTHTLVQNDPNQATKPMGNGPDGLIVSQARHQSAIDDLENGSFRLGCGVGTLIKNAPHMAIALRGAVVLGYPCALFVSRACSHPGRELLGGRKGCCRGTPSAMICCAESTPRPGTSASRSTAA